jgi:hypothetical protein
MSAKPLDGKKKTSRTTPATVVSLMKPMPFDTSERKIGRSADQALSKTGTFLRTLIATMKTKEAITEYWRSLYAYAERNHSACRNAELGTEAPKLKTRGAGKAA